MVHEYEYEYEGPQTREESRGRRGLSGWHWTVLLQQRHLTRTRRRCRPWKELQTSKEKNTAGPLQDTFVLLLGGSPVIWLYGCYMAIYMVIFYFYILCGSPRNHKIESRPNFVAPQDQHRYGALRPLKKGESTDRMGSLCFTIAMVVGPRRKAMSRYVERERED